MLNSLVTNVIMVLTLFSYYFLNSLHFTEGALHEKVTVRCSATFLYFRSAANAGLITDQQLSTTIGGFSGGHVIG